MPLAAMFPLAFINVGPPEMVILCVIAVLLFGRRLPEIGRTLGKGIIEFKKGIAGIEEEIESASRKPPPWRAHAEPEPAALPDASKADTATLTASPDFAEPETSDESDDGSHGYIPPHSA